MIKFGPKPIDPKIRFWRFVKKTDSCWIWIGCKDKHGYGYFYNKTSVAAYRFSWEMHNGPIPDGLCVLHRCDNPPCIRPDHLFLGTQIENIRDMASKGRAQKGQKHHFSKLTDDKILAIRHVYAEGGYTYKQLAQHFDVCAGTIRHIVKRRIWKHLA